MTARALRSARCLALSPSLSPHLSPVVSHSFLHACLSSPCEKCVLTEMNNFCVKRMTQATNLKMSTSPSPAQISHTGTIVALICLSLLFGLQLSASSTHERRSRCLSVCLSGVCLLAPSSSRSTHHHRLCVGVHSRDQELSPSSPSPWLLLLFPVGLSRGFHVCLLTDKIANRASRLPAHLATVLLGLNGFKHSAN